MSCQGCRAYALQKRANELLGRRYVHSERRDENFQIAAVLLKQADVLCYNLRVVNCCSVNTKSGQFMVHARERRPEAVPVPWPVFQSVAIPHLVGDE